MHRRKKLRLREWLVEMIDAGLYGLEWVGHPDNKTFRVPWKHGSRHGWSVKDDAALFQAWATYTGKYKEGRDRPDPRKWKTNFRCALNALPDIKEIREKSCPRGKDAFKIYRMRNVRRGGQSLSLQTRTKDLKRPQDPRFKSPTFPCFPPQTVPLTPFDPFELWPAQDRRGSMSDDDAAIVTMVDDMMRMNEAGSPCLSTASAITDTSPFCYAYLTDTGTNQFPFPRPHVLD